MNLDFLVLFFQITFLEFLVFWFFYRKRLSWNKIFLMSLFVNAITYPFTFFGFMTENWGYMQGLLVSYVFSVLVELILHFQYGQLDKGRAFSLALISNFVSWQCSPWLSYLLQKI